MRRLIAQSAAAVLFRLGARHIRTLTILRESLVRTYEPLFTVVSYDAGLSRANADTVIAAGKDYLFAHEDESRTMCQLAEEMLRFEPVLHQTTDVMDNATMVVRSLRLVRSDPSWSYGDGKCPSGSLWPHAKAFLLVECVTIQDGVVLEREDRMYVASLDPGRLTTATRPRGPRRRTLICRAPTGGADIEARIEKAAAPAGAGPLRLRLPRCVAHRPTGCPGSQDPSSRKSLPIMPSRLRL